jgi:hypothetical protein
MYKFNFLRASLIAMLFSSAALLIFNLRNWARSFRSYPINLDL